MDKNPKGKSRPKSKSAAIDAPHRTLPVREQLATRNFPVIGIIGQNVDAILRIYQCLAKTLRPAYFFGQKGSGITAVGKLALNCRGVTELDLDYFYKTPAEAVGPLK